MNQSTSTSGEVFVFICLFILFYFIFFVKKALENNDFFEILSRVHLKRFSVILNLMTQTQAQMLPN